MRRNGAPWRPSGEGPGAVRRAAYRAAEFARVRTAGRQGLRDGIHTAMKLGTAGIAYGALVEPRLVQVTQVDIGIRGLPSTLDGYRVLHLTDIHFNWIQGEGFLRRVVERSNALDADMVALTGDFITHNPRRMERCLDILSGLRAPDGLWAVRGNHDAPLGEHRTRAMMERRGIRLLENEHDHVEPRRHRLHAPRCGRAHRLVVGGVGDLWTGECSPGRALASADQTAPTLLLSHNPQAATIVPTDVRVDLMLSGHTHGGQVRVFNRPVPLFAGGESVYVSGLAQSRGMKVYVSRGVGTSALQFRWNCRPEIALLVLRPEPA
jgi:predicted MPP superfamily phosphohydrolase